MDILQDNLQLIAKLAQSFAQTGTGEYDDLFQDGCEQVLKLAKNYNAEKGAQTTFIWGCLRNYFSTKFKYKGLKQKGEFDASFFADTHTTVDPLKILLHRESVKTLSPNAQFVVEEIKKYPGAFISVGYTSRGQVRRYLKNEYGWGYIRILKVIRELRDFVKTLEA